MVVTTVIYVMREDVSASDICHVWQAGMTDEMLYNCLLNVQNKDFIINITNAYWMIQL